MARKPSFLIVMVFLCLSSVGALAAETSLNAYSIWPENWARPMFEEFEKATGIHVNFVRFSSGEALVRVIAEKNNPQVDVLFGGPVETHSAGIKEGVFEPYKPPSFAVLGPRFKNAEGYWVGIADGESTGDGNRVCRQAERGHHSPHLRSKCETNSRAPHLGQLFGLQSG